jgi:hypothetical protein
VVGGKGFESHSPFLNLQVAELQSEAWMVGNQESFNLAFLYQAA